MSVDVELVAGAELDAAVAMNLFGISRVYCRYGELWTPDMVLGPTDRQFYIPSGKPWRTHSIDAIPLPRYSRDIGAAWAVVERMRELGYWFELRDHEDTTHRDLWEAEFQSTTQRQDGWATAKTAAEVICRAALAAQAGGEG